MFLKTLNEVKKSYCIALALLSVGSTFVVPAQADLAEQFFDPVDGRFDASTYLSDNAFGFLPIPVIITEPAVDGGVGMTGLFFHESDEDAAVRKDAMLSSGNAAAHLMPPSVSAVFGAYTGNESWVLGAGHMGFFKEGEIRYQGGGGYADFNLDYYSIGNIELSKPFSLNTQSAVVFQTLKFQVADSPVFIGATQRYIDAELSLRKSNDNAGGDLSKFLSTDVTTSGLGLVAEFDSRDNFFTPKTGFYYNFSYVAYRDGIGSDIEYDLYRLGGLNYFRISKSVRGVLRLNAEIADSDEVLPPFAQPTLSLRGVPAARYQGTHVGVFEGEVTWELDARWSLLGFAGVGRASNSGSDFSSASSRVSKGVGFRYEIARRYGLHMGVDVARGPEDTVLYIQAGSAW